MDPHQDQPRAMWLLDATRSATGSPRRSRPSAGRRIAGNRFLCIQCRPYAVGGRTPLQGDGLWCAPPAKPSAGRGIADSLEGQYVRGHRAKRLRRDAASIGLKAP
jgi:hypothetical protein